MFNFYDISLVGSCNFLRYAINHVSTMIKVRPLSQNISSRRRDHVVVFKSGPNVNPRNYSRFPFPKPYPVPLGILG